MYGLKYVGITWWQFLSKKLNGIGFEQKDTDQCVFKKENVFTIFCVDYYIIL